MATLQPRLPLPVLPDREIRPFPARNLSYRALSIIDAYCSDISQPEDDNNPQAVLKSIQRLRSKRETTNESYASNFDIDEAYGSGEADLNEDDMGEVISLDDYDPYRSTTPPPRTSSRLKVQLRAETVEVKPEPPPKPSYNEEYDPYKSRTPPAQSTVKGSAGLASRSEPILAIFDDPAIQPALPPKDVPQAGNWKSSTTSKSASRVNLVLTPNSANKDKALPTVPRKQNVSLSGNKEQSTEKELPGIPKEMAEELRSRKDSMIQSDKGKSSVTTGPRTKSSPNLPNTGLKIQSPKRLIGEEAAIRATRGINRAGKPATLVLTKSNGSTAASIAKANIKVAKLAPTTIPLKPASPVSQLLDTTSTALVDKGNSLQQVPFQITPPHAASESATVTATTTTTGNSNPAQSSADQHSVSLDDVSIADDESGANTNPNMHRIKNLVKRKPVGASKENSISTPSTSQTKGGASLPSNPYPPHHIHHPSSNLALSPTSNQSLEKFPPLESETSSTTTILAPRSDAGKPTTPPVLRSPTPLSQLEESPSKYALERKSEHNLRPVDEKRQSQTFRQGSNGVLRFITTQKALQDCLSEGAPRSPIVDASTVTQNESKRMSFYHASLLEYIRERPHDSNAPQLSTAQLHCHNDHLGQWFMSSNIVHPINCALCDVQGGSRWTCSSCGLRVCQDCCEKVKNRAENTEFGQMLREAKNKIARRTDFAAQRARSNTATTERTITPSRLGSPVSYPPPDSNTPYANQLAVSSTHSLSGSIRSSQGQRDVRVQQYPPSAWNRPPAPSYGRPFGHRQRMSADSASAPDVPHTSYILDQHVSDQNSNISMPPSSKGSEIEMRGRTGNSPDRGRQHSAARYGSPMREPPDGRARSKTRVPPTVALDSMAELRKGPSGPYPEMPGGAGARTPGWMQ